MGSIAQDKDGDLAVGYSTSNANQYPDIAFTGRKPDDGTALSSSKIVYELIEP